MTNFVIHLDSECPSRFVYLGIGVDQDSRRFAILAKQVEGDSDVGVISPDLFFLRRFTYEGSQLPDDNPDAYHDLKLMQQAERDVLSTSPAQFIVDDKACAIYRMDDREVIAASGPHGRRIAVCEVEGAVEPYSASCAVPVLPHGTYRVYRLHGEHGLN